MLHGAKDGVNDAAPFLSPHEAKARPLKVRTAVLMTLRNEAPERALQRLKAVRRSLDATGEGGRFSYFVLSDTTDPEIARAEERCVAEWEAEARACSSAGIVYRRRSDNTGYKAGNIRDFCETYGRSFELMLPLDADSLMTGPAIVDLARIMEAHPRLGILQSLVVGTPSPSPFARIFQFGMRLGMRSYTIAQAWWAGDCGPFWGHNALVRIKPFVQHCALPQLPGAPPLGGHILSHDQVEAALMRRGGYEVRVMPVEGGSYEDNPPDVLEFVRRDVRWCQGNMQYLKLLATPGLKPTSRFQLLWASAMFIGVPAWTLMIGLLPFAALEATSVPAFPQASAEALYLVILAMYLAPKLAGAADALATPGEAQRFGGRVRFLCNALLEIAISFLQGAISTIRTTIFMLGLPFGKSIVWSGQQRDAHRVPWSAAGQALWPHLLFGCWVIGGLAVISPRVLLWSLPLTAGYVLAIPYAVASASPRLGGFMRRHGVAAIPEDLSPPAELAAIAEASRAELAA